MRVDAEVTRYNNNGHFNQGDIETQFTKENVDTLTAQKDEWRQLEQETINKISSFWSKPCGMIKIGFEPKLNICCNKM